METKLKSRLQILLDEYQKGQQQLKKLEQETDELKTTLLRISGAIQVLQELLENDENSSKNSKSSVNVGNPELNANN